MKPRDNKPSLSILLGNETGAKSKPSSVLVEGNYQSFDTPGLSLLEGKFEYVC